MVQFCMTGKDIGSAQGDCPFAGGDMKSFTAVVGGEMFLKPGAESSGNTFRDEDLAVIIDNLYGKLDAVVESDKHRAQSFLRNDSVQ